MFAECLRKSDIIISMWPLRVTVQQLIITVIIKFYEVVIMKLSKVQLCNNYALFLTILFY